VLADDRACTPLPPQNLHGKEGVDGSSPSEGLSGTTKPLQMRLFLLPRQTLRTTSLARRGSAVSDDNRGLRKRRDQAVREPDLLEQPGLGTGFGDGFGRSAAWQGNAIANALDPLRGADDRANVFRLPRSLKCGRVDSDRRPQLWSVARVASARSRVAAQLPRSFSASSEREPGSAA
jgi:hypothetical protein